MIILVDMDDTIEDLLSSWCNWLNKNYGTTVDSNNVNNWEVASFFPQLTSQQIFEPLNNREFWKTVKPKEDAIEYLKKLFDEGNDIYIVTASNYKTLQSKYECIIEKYFSFIDWDHVIVTSNKQLIQGHILIDDGPHNLEGGTYLRILFTAPHNRSYDAELNGMIRVFCWKEVYDIIHTLGCNS